MRLFAQIQIVQPLPEFLVAFPPDHGQQPRHLLLVLVRRLRPSLALHPDQLVAEVVDLPNKMRIQFWMLLTFSGIFLVMEAFGRMQLDHFIAYLAKLGATRRKVLTRKVLVLGNTKILNYIRPIITILSYVLNALGSQYHSKPNSLC